MYCQKCKSPLKLDRSLEDISPAALQQLVEASATANKYVNDESRHSRPLFTEEQSRLYHFASRGAHDPIIKRSTNARGTSIVPDPALDAQAAGFKDNSAMSFVVLSESQVMASVASPSITAETSLGTRGSDATKSQLKSHELASEDSLLPHKAETIARLFEILSSRSDVDYPICVECTEMLLESMEKRLREASAERDIFIEFLQSSNAELATKEEQRQAELELRTIREEEDAAFAELEVLEREKAALEKEIVTLGLESRRIDKEEESFWRERNTFDEALSQFRADRDSVLLRYEYDSKQLDRLRRTNVYNDTFCISYDGLFATINGLRLGRLSTVTVEWAEINAAWGQACLLLVIVSEKLRFNFQGYRLNPMGSSSTIDRFERPQQAGITGQATSKALVYSLELFYSGDLPLTFPFTHRKFDNAMVAFLECVRQVGEHIERNLSGRKLPYEINKDKIHDISIKLGGFGQEDWTRACKCTLTNCKFLLAYVCNPSPGAQGALT